MHTPVNLTAAETRKRHVGLNSPHSPSSSCTRHGFRLQAAASALLPLHTTAQCRGAQHSGAPGAGVSERAGVAPTPGGRTGHSAAGKTNAGPAKQNRGALCRRCAQGGAQTPVNAAAKERTAGVQLNMGLLPADTWRRAGGRHCDRYSTSHSTKTAPTSGCSAHPPAHTSKPLKISPLPLSEADGASAHKWNNHTGFCVLPQHGPVQFLWN